MNKIREASIQYRKNNAMVIHPFFPGRPCVLIRIVAPYALLSFTGTFFSTVLFLNNKRWTKRKRTAVAAKVMMAEKQKTWVANAKPNNQADQIGVTGKPAAVNATSGMTQAEAQTSIRRRKERMPFKLPRW
jgi:hypothetical protein